MILTLWNIAKKQSNGINSKQDFCQYLCETFINDISEETMFKLMDEGING